MSFVVCMFLIGLVVGLVAVASNPSPYFAALGLVVVSGMGCGILVSSGGPFLSLVLFLIYLGGMLVVFAYSAALAAEPYPEGWFSGPVVMYMVVYLVIVTLMSVPFWGEWFEVSWVPVDEAGEFLVLRGDIGGVALMYSLGGGMLVLTAWMLLLTLFVVLELTRGMGRGTVRAV
uniref:NADH-ubiquinone oxidoreductase chain 6 n=1 Tax=Parajulis poecilepterus TaxID=356780 RepID=A4UIH8_9LABR|nr:NADH dehydrogenase subunit 6 [Parajulis poecilepterus]ABP03893.1 NADH dehydrogenase subunit 6 [Parajulis poecilepterus]